MKVEEVSAMISHGEGQKVEFKETFAEQDDAIRSLCAFAHAEGGTVVFGLSDDGRVKGVSLGKNTIENFVKKLRSSTEPHMHASVDPVMYSGMTLVHATVPKAGKGQLFYAFGMPYIRVGKTDQIMTPDEMKWRIFANFHAENLGPQKPKLSAGDQESWSQREARRCGIYEQNRGLFLVHTWRPSSEPGQVADVVIKVVQHKEGPLTSGVVKSVEYHLGPKFFDRTVVKTDADDGFRLEVSAYAPMLCLARVNFDDGTQSVDLERYIDFWPSAKAEMLTDSAAKGLPLGATSKECNVDEPRGERVFSPKGIIGYLESLPPAQRDAGARSYEGIHVSWKVSLYDVHIKSGGVTRLMTLSDTRFPWVYCEVDIHLYPELKVMKRGVRLIVDGLVASVEGNAITIKDARLSFNVEA